jgi:hypothetical protein
MVEDVLGVPIAIISLYFDNIDFSFVNLTWVNVVELASANFPELTDGLLAGKHILNS